MKNNSLDILKKQGSGFKTPKGYFNSVEDEVFAKLITEKLPEKEGFSMPKNYFETIEDKVLQNITQEKLSEKVNFEVPKGYFDTIEDKVFEKIKNEDLKQQPKIIDFKSRVIKVLPPIAIAASLLLFIVLNYNSNNGKYTMEKVASSDIETWVDNNLITFESEEIAEVFSDVSLEEELNSEDEELLDYLNGMDVESIFSDN